MANLKKIWEENTDARLKSLRFKPREDSFDPKDEKLNKEMEDAIIEKPDDVIRHFNMECAVPDRAERTHELLQLCSNIPNWKAIVYCEEAHVAELKDKLSDDEFPQMVVDTATNMQERIECVSKLESGEFNVLISPNVKLFGLDDCKRNMVIMFDIPKAQDGKGDINAYNSNVGHYF